MAGDLISREALDRIIQRAAELQTGERDIGEGLSESELLALGKDVGIPPRYLKQALLEERTGALVPSRAARSLAGPAEVAVQRIVPGDRGGVERSLSLWMEDQELLRVKRRYPDRTTWEPQVGFVAAMRRGLQAGGRRFALTRAAEIVGQVTPIETGFCHVRLSADVRNLRRARLGGATFLVSLGAVATVASTMIGVLAPYAMAPAAAFGIAATAVLFAGRRQQLEQIEVGMEQVLDRLERGEIRPEHALPRPRASAFVRIAEEIRKQFQF